ncbi:MAG: DUF429 domain-containing protein [Candidatus Sumerlaeia bacterium]|nr:DUF429 domain-containing protein [Candidatus Sumerlaeia bacterium]
MVSDRLSRVTAGPHVVGVDGCPAGWIGAALNLDSGRFTFMVFNRFASLLDTFPDAQCIAVDIPIGLYSAAEPGGRECDREARALLGRGKTSSVFSAPCRGVLSVTNYPDALQVNRASSSHGIGLSIQAYNIVPKIREVDECLTPALQEKIREVHPEVSFRALNGGNPIAEGKKSLAGREIRRRLLAKNGFQKIAMMTRDIRVKAAGKDDILDALAACWSARRIALGTGERIPPVPPVDSKGLRMEIWW